MPATTTTKLVHSRQVTLDTDQSATFSTDGFSGFYVIQDPDGNILYFENGEVAERDTRSNVEKNGNTGTSGYDPVFEVNTQTLDVDFDDSNVDDETTDAEYEVDSNRGSFVLNVTANGDLDATELQDLFSDNGTTNGFAAADIQTVRTKTASPSKASRREPTRQTSLTSTLVSTPSTSK